MEEPRQYWIRNEHGKVWGPLAFATIELLIENGMIQGRLEASRDGIHFQPPGRLPDLRDAFPRELWGEVGDDGALSAPAGPPVVGPPGSRPTPAPQAAPPRLTPAPSAVPQRQIPTVMPTAAPGRQTPAPQRPIPTVAPAANRPTPVPQRPIPTVAPAANRPTPAPQRPVPTVAPAANRPAPAPAAAPQRPVEVARAAAPAGEPALSGELGGSGALRAWYEIASGGLTGRLTLEGGTTYSIYFRRGTPEAVSSSLASEDFGELACARGLLKAEQLADARKMSANYGGELVNALFGMGLLNPANAYKLIGEHASSLLPRALAMEAGRYRFDVDVPAPATAMPLGDRWKLLGDVVRGWTAEEIRRRLGPAIDAPIMRSGGKVELAELKLTAQEARAAGWFDGVRSLEQLTAALPAEAETILRVGLLLWCVEAVSFAAVRPRPTASRATPPPSSATRPPAGSRPATAGAAPTSAQRPTPTRPTPPPVVSRTTPPTTASRPTSAAAATRPTPAPTAPSRTTRPPVAPGRPAAAANPDLPGNDVASLKAYVQKLEGKNHFEVLGLTESATSPQIKTAYFALARNFHPDTVPAGAPAELGRLKADVFARVGEAYRVLSDEKSRATYLDELKFGGSDEQVDVSRILAAEECFQKGCILVRARKFTEAEKMLDEAIALNDMEGEYYAWRAWARFAASTEKPKVKDRAMREIETSIKMNPRCAMSYYFAGQISKLLGDKTGAESWFKKTLNVDPNHIEAQRELRLLAGRK